MILKSGECFQGEVGKPSGLTDVDGNDLYIGDIVLLLNLDDYDKSHNRITCQCGLEYVCQNSKDCNYDEDTFVMGIKSSYQNHNGEITQDDDWKVFKVKSYEDIVVGEKWGVVRAVSK